MIIKEVFEKAFNELNNLDIEDLNFKLRLIIADSIGKEKEYVMIHNDEEISNEDYELCMSRIEKLKNNIPIQYILNEQEFMGFNFYVDENVLIPQPDTENLVEEVIKLSEDFKEQNNIKILDMCTGSGAIAISLSKLIKKSVVYGSDISKAALKIAEDNSMTNEANVLFFESDMFKQISSIYNFDIIVSNPPYIETSVIETLSEEVKNEPHIALDGGEDGLDFYREIIANSHDYLNDNGYLAFEIGYNQKEAVEELLRNNGFKNVYTKKDLAGNDRVVVGQK